MASLKEERLESYLIDGQERFYRLAYSYLQNREEALDAVQTAVCGGEAWSGGTACGMREPWGPGSPASW